MPTESKFQLRVASPCRASWDNMDGDEQVRFCRECTRNVYNLSEMTEDEARRVIAEREGRLCVRFYQRRDGTVLTSDCPVGQRRYFLRAGAGTALALAGIAAGLSASSACGPVEDGGALMGEVEPHVVMGRMPPESDAGTPTRHETGDPDAWIMGDIALPEGEAIMGKIAPPHDAE